MTQSRAQNAGQRASEFGMILLDFIIALSNSVLAMSSPHPLQCVVLQCHCLSELGSLLLISLELTVKGVALSLKDLALHCLMLSTLNSVGATRCCMTFEVGPNTFYITG